MSQQVTLPTHVGIILDGNRRWAEAKGLPKLEGHRAGAENMKVVADHLFDRGVKYLTAYIFSTENWKRSEEEVTYLMKKIMPIVFKNYLQHFIDKGVRIHWLGRKEKLSQAEIDMVEHAVEMTKDLDKAHLGFCFNYGGKQEITDAVKRIVTSGVKAEDITPGTIRENLYASEIPDVDLIIRTSGELRLSNFMLWRAAYSELTSIATPWPGVTTEQIDNAIDEFIHRQRRYGC